jgi:hypothetical protein
MRVHRERGFEFPNHGHFISNPTSVVDAKEEREIAVIDVPNAFIQTVVEDEKKRVITFKSEQDRQKGVTHPQPLTLVLNSYVGAT